MVHFVVVIQFVVVMVIMVWLMRNVMILWFENALVNADYLCV